MTSPGLYPQLLGPAWRELAPPVRHFHGDGQGFTARGVFQVRHGERRLARWLAWLLRMPPAGEAVPLRLTVTPTTDGEHWQRSFAGRLYPSTQTSHPQGWLAERAGPVEFRFRLSVQEAALHYDTVAVALRLGPMRLPLPRWLAPCITAWEKAAPCGCHVRIDAVLPLLGRLITYEGVVTRDEACA